MMTSIIGSEFYVMDRSEGHLIHTKIPTEWNWSQKEVRQLCVNFFQNLIDLHQVDYQASRLV